MARMISVGFEAQSTGTAELETLSGTAPSISTSIKHGGAASARWNLTASTGRYGHNCDVSPAAGTKDWWLRTYIYIASAPTNNTKIIQMRSDATDICAIRLTSTRTLQLWDSVSNTQEGSDSSALSVDTWYRVELSYDYSSGDITGRVDGAQFASGTAQATTPINIFQLGVFDSTTCDLYFDDAAANDSAGSDENSWPGDGYIVHLLPDSAGDNNAWLKQGGGAGDSNNYQSVDEVTPDDATTYLKRTSTGTHIESYNCQTSASAGIGASDTIKFVSVGFRGGATSATATGRSLTLRLKGQASGTVASSGTIDISVNGWITHADPIPRIYKLTEYLNPQDSAAWAASDLDTMQIGFQNAVSSANEIRVSALWALVEYVPGFTTHTATATLTGAGSEVIAATTTGLGAAALSGLGAQVIAATTTGFGAALLTGLGSQVTVGHHTALALAALAGLGDLTAAGVRAHLAAAALSGLGGETITANTTTLAAALLSGLGALEGIGHVTGFGAALLTGTGSQVVDGHATGFAAAALSGTGALDATALRIAVGSAALTGTSSEVITAHVTSFGLVVLTGLGDLTADAVVIAVLTHLAAAHLSGNGDLSARVVRGPAFPSPVLERPWLHWRHPRR